MNEDFNHTSWTLALNSALSVKSSMTDVRENQCELTTVSIRERYSASHVYNLLIAYIPSKGRRHTPARIRSRRSPLNVVGERGIKYGNFDTLK